MTEERKGKRIEISCDKLGNKMIDLTVQDQNPGDKTPFRTKCTNWIQSHCNKISGKTKCDHNVQTWWKEM